LLDSIELGIPHQANKTMVTDLAAAAGLAPDRLYFNIDKVGNVSAASIPIAIHDSVRDGVIEQPTRVFAPGFGAGAVGGYVVLRIDPEIVAIEKTEGLARRRRISIRRPTRRLRRLTNSLIGRVGQAA
jgi:3-oxoacyl-[acyl-carrier-protein] synthase III